MLQLKLDDVVSQLGKDASPGEIIARLRSLEPLASGFYSFCDWVGLDVFLPRTAEQAGATYYIISLILFVIGRFSFTGLMRFFKPRTLLTILSVVAFICCMVAIYGKGWIGIYGLVCISGCMSLMFPTIYGLGITGLGSDTKIGGAGMIMAIAGAAVLTQIQGMVSDQMGSIQFAFWVPAIAFLIIAFYGGVISKKISEKMN